MALLLGLFAALCWSIHDLAARRLAHNVGAFRLGIFTEVAGFIVVLPALIGTPVASFADWVGVAILGITYGAAIAGLFKAFAMAPVSVVGPFTAGYPALIVIWGMVGGLIPTWTEIISISAILSGAVIVGRSGHHNGGMNVVQKGKVPELMFWILLADFCFAAAIIMGQKLGPVFGDMRTAGLLRVPAAIVLIPFALMDNGAKGKITANIWRVVLGMGMLDIAALTGINAMGAMPYKELGAMGISAYGAIAVPLAMVWLKEKVSRGEWSGIALITAGIAGLGSQIG